MTSLAKKPTASQWLQGARPRTLLVALSPVFVGTAAASLYHRPINVVLVLLALVVTLGLQVGVNYANDYSDGVKGTDEVRVGPLRLTASGTAKPEHVKRAAFISFGVATLAGIIVTLMTQHWSFIFLGLASLGAAWGYTGGKNPYGYRGLGEVSVFIFFGLVATLGSEFIQSGKLSWPGWVGAVSVGAIACGVLVANNLRDRINDAKVGKMTLATKLGDKKTRMFYIVLVALPLISALALAPISPWFLLLLCTAALLVKPAQIVNSGAKGLELVPVLKLTGIASLGYAVLFCIATIAHHLTS